MPEHQISLIGGVAASLKQLIIKLTGLMFGIEKEVYQMSHYRKSRTAKTVTIVVRVEAALEEDIHAIIRQHPTINTKSAFVRYALGYAIDNTDPELATSFEGVHRTLERAVGMYIRNSTGEMPSPADRDVALPYPLIDALHAFTDFVRHKMKSDNDNH